MRWELRETEPELGYKQNTMLCIDSGLAIAITEANPASAQLCGFKQSSRRTCIYSDISSG